MRCREFHFSCKKDRFHIFMKWHKNATSCSKYSITILACKNVGDSTFEFSSVQSLDHGQLFATPWTAACYASLPVHHQLLEHTQTNVHRVGDPTISSSVILLSSCHQCFQALRSFQMSQFFASGVRIIGVPRSESVLSMNSQHLFHLASLSPRDT